MTSDFITSLLSNIWSLFVIILFFGGSIFVHELGHFLAARRRGVKVDRFSIGFGPAIWKWRGKDGVEYRVSWLPLGGYVALPQLADMREIEGESEADPESLPPISYSTKILVFVMGAVFNLIFAFILATILWVAGRPEPESITTTTVGYVEQNMRFPDGTEGPSPAAIAGIKPGDIIRSIDGRPINDWPGLQTSVVLGTNVDETGDRLAQITVERDGELLEFPVRPVRVGDERFRRIGIGSAYQPIVAGIRPDSPADKIGLRTDDRIATVDGVRVFGLSSIYERLDATDAASVTLGVMRGDTNVTLEVPKPGSDRVNPLTGLAWTMPWRLRYQDPIEQFVEVIDTTIRTLRTLLHPRGDLSLSNLSGPIGIGRGFWDAAKSDYPIRFAIWFAVLVNVNLAIFNLLPIPVLDGGHMAFATIARLRGKALPARFIMATQSVFIVLLFSMMLYVTVFGDLRRMVRDHRAEAQAREAVEQQNKASEQPAPATP